PPRPRRIARVRRAVAHPRLTRPQRDARNKGRRSPASTSVIATSTGIPIATSPGGQSRTFPTRKTPSSSRTTTAPYGVRAVNGGSVGEWITVAAQTSPRPEAGPHSCAVDPHTAHTGRGGWRYVPHAAHRWIRSSPAATYAQKRASSAATGSGRGRAAFTGRLRAERRRTDR